MNPDQIFRKPCLISLSSLAVVGLKIAAYRYFDSYGLFVWARILFTTVSDCCVSRVTSHIPVCLFLVPFIISCPLFWTVISCLSSVMVYLSSHRTPNDISWAIHFLLILSCLYVGPCRGIWSVAMCDVSIVLPSSILAVMLFDIMIGVLGLLISI